MAIQSGYKKPGVTIIQQVTSTAATLVEPSLYPCIVGPAYRIVTDSSTGSYDGTSQLYSYPNIESTDEVDLSSVTVKVIRRDSTSELPSSDYTVNTSGVTLDGDITVESDLDDATGSTGESTADSTVFVDSNAEFIVWGVESGDKLVITSGSDSGEYSISSVVSDSTILLDSTLAHSYDNLDYYIKEVDHIGSGLGSTVLISYRALRTDVDSVITIESESDASSQLGAIDNPDNPLGYAVYLALIAGNTQIKALGVTADTQSEYSSAFNKLETEDVYSIVPLTQQRSVLSVLKSHVENMSDPDEKKERIGFANIELSLRAVRLNTTDATIVADSGDIYILNRPGAQFLSNSVANGDRVYFEEVTEYESAPSTSYVVREVTSEDSIKIESSTNIAGTQSTITVASPEFTRLQQAEHIRDIASSIESKRVVLTWPDKVVVSPLGSDQTVGGYFLNAAIASAVATLPPQQGFTRLRVSGIDNLLHSNIGYFTDSQLNTMASGGVMILVQQTRDAVPEIRHQYTTDVTKIEYRELSIVKNVDYIAKFLRERLEPYVGTWNIHEFFIQTVKVTLQACFDALKLVDEISGPNITEGSIVSIEQNDTYPDRVDIVVDLGIPYPANDIRVTLRI